MTVFVLGPAYANTPVSAYSADGSTFLGSATTDALSAVDFPSAGRDARIFTSQLTITVFDDGTMTPFQGDVVLRRNSDNVEIGRGTSDASGVAVTTVSPATYTVDYTVYEIQSTTTITQTITTRWTNVNL